MRIDLPKEVRTIIGILQTAGFEAYAVGGCVRDTLLGRTPEDWDITTSAAPQQIKELFHATVDTGIRHGTVTVLLNHTGYEVTTYRLDGKYEDHRHPKEVVFTGDLSEDLKRRDFTINAMAYNEEQGLVDLFGGREDLEKGIIRCVGDPVERFSEDALRIMRAARFSAQLGFSVSEDTLEAMKRLSPDLKRVSAERVRTELTKLLLSDHPEKLLTCYECGITAVVFPEFDRMMGQSQNNPHHCYNVGVHTVKCLEYLHTDPDYIRADKKLRTVLNYTMLLHDVAKPLCVSTDKNGQEHFYGHQELGAELAADIMKRLKFDNETIHAVKKLVKYHDARFQIRQDSRKALRKLVSLVGVDMMPYLFPVGRSDNAGQSETYSSQSLENLQRIESMYREILERKECVCLRDLAVTGRDLMEIGYTSGPSLGQALKALLHEVIQDPERNTREQLLALSAEYLKQGWIPEYREE